MPKTRLDQPDPHPHSVSCPQHQKGSHLVTRLPQRQPHRALTIYKYIWARLTGRGIFTYGDLKSTVLPALLLHLHSLWQVHKRTGRERKRHEPNVGRPNSAAAAAVAVAVTEPFGPWTSTATWMNYVRYAQANSYRRSCPHRNITKGKTSIHRIRCVVRQCARS